jgi:hypothetical protein
MGYVIKGKNVTVDRTDATLLLAHYRAAKDAEKAAKLAAQEAHDSLVALAGDAEILVDASNLQLCKLPEISRRTMPLQEALLLHPDLESIVHTSEYRRVMR